MKNEEFDNLIKAAADKDLEVPPFLDWGNMHIPVKKKKKRFVFLWFPLLLLIGFLGTWTWTSKAKDKSEKDISFNTSIEPNSTLEKNAPSSNAEASLTVSFQGHVISGIEKKNESFTPQALPIKTGNDSIHLSSSMSYIKHLPDIIPVDNETNSFNANGIDMKNSVVQNAQNLTLEEIKNPNNRPGLLMEMIPSRFPLLAPIQGSLLHSSSSRILPEMPRTAAWQLTAGFDSYRNRTASSGGSSNAFGINSIGQTIAIAHLRQIKKMTHSIIGLRYTRLNHYYQEVRDLGYENDLNTGQRILNQYVLRHRNHHHLVGIDLGLHHAIRIAPRFQAYIQGEVSPVMSLASNGKLFAPGSADVIELSNNNTSTTLLFSGTLGLGVSYAMNSKARFIFGPSFTHYFNGFQLASGLDESIKPQILTLCVGFRKSIY